MLMKQLYIAVRYFYITNQLIMEEDYQAIYTSMVVHLVSDDHLHIPKFVYEGLLSSLLK